MNGRPASRQGLRKPLRQHYARSAEASTPRTTFVDGEQVLSAWMAENAFVSWVMRERPWDLEGDLIRELDLPLNLQGNRRNRIMKFNDQDRQCFVTLSPFASLRVNSAKGLARWAQRCFAEFTLSAANVLSMTGPILIGNNHHPALTGARARCLAYAIGLSSGF